MGAEADPQYLTYAGHHLGYSHLGYAGVGYHPYTTFYGKREAEADPQYLTYAGHHLGYSHLGYGYAGYHPYTTFYGKREADPQVVTYVFLLFIILSLMFTMLLSHTLLLL